MICPLLTHGSARCMNTSMDWDVGQLSSIRVRVGNGLKAVEGTMCVIPFGLPSRTGLECVIFVDIVVDMHEYLILCSLMRGSSLVVWIALSWGNTTYRFSRLGSHGAATPPTPPMASWPPPPNPTSNGRYFPLMPFDSTFFSPLPSSRSACSLQLAACIVLRYPCIQPAPLLIKNSQSLPHLFLIRISHFGLLLLFQRASTATGQ